MNLYNYHSNPEQLDGYEDRKYLVPELAFEYAKEQGVRVPKVEAAIMRDPHLAYFYVRDIIGGRWPEAETAIMQNPQLAYLYAKNIISDRWPEAEPVIMKDPNMAYLYAKYVIADPWPEAEPHIMKSDFWWSEYKKEFIL